MCFVRSSLWTEVDISFAQSGQTWLVGINSSDGGIVWGTLDEHGGWSSTLVRSSIDSPRLSATSLEGSEFRLPIIRVGDPVAVEPASFADSRPRDALLTRLLAKFENAPDGLSVFGDQTRVFSYASPTERYPHGTLGDRTEWTELVDAAVARDQDVDRYALPANEVFEGLFPLVPDLDNARDIEVVTTVSNPETGSRLVVFGYDGDNIHVIAESEPIGTGFRWLHQIAVAPFGPDGEFEIAVIETPHVGGIAKFYRLDGDRLVLTASRAGGYMSHVNGSRNLD